MAVEKTILVRRFMYEQQEIPDPNPELEPTEVQAVHALTYPELANATLQGPETCEKWMTYSYQRKIGTKG